MSDRLAAVDVTCVEGTATVTVRGEIDIATADVLARALQLACDQQPTRVLIDLADATFFGLTGLDLVLGIRESLARHGATVQVVNATTSVEKMMTVLGVSSLAGPGLIAVPSGGEPSRWRTRRRRVSLVTDVRTVVADR
jgi:anti-sigma B factor antagonist